MLILITSLILRNPSRSSGGRPSAGTVPSFRLPGLLWLDKKPLQDYQLLLAEFLWALCVALVHGPGVKPGSSSALNLRQDQERNHHPPSYS